MFHSDRYHCRVCGLRQEEPTWLGEQLEIPTYDICDCCGAEFGIEDEVFGSVLDYRQRWMERGMPWFSPGRKPEPWDINHQLAQIPAGFRFSRIIETLETYLELFEAGDLDVLKHARVHEDVLLALLDRDFERFAPLLAQTHILPGLVWGRLIREGDREVLQLLLARLDLRFRQNVAHRIEQAIQALGDES